MNGYPVAVMLRAQEHRELGWSLERTSQLLGEEFGVTPAPETIRLWTDRKALVRKRAQGRAVEVRQRLAVSPGRLGVRNHTQAFQEHRCRALADQGVPYLSIARVMAFDYPDGRWNDDRVRRLLGPSRERRALRVAA